MPWWAYLGISLGGLAAGYYPAALFMACILLKGAKNTGYRTKQAAQDGMILAIIWPLILVVWVPMMGIRRMHRHMMKVLEARA